ncbi:MAG: methyltransferase domain-containing protein [Desulfohalobiaceae bacterium]|nr:methyltransferase domain-containing protein [Desulfohalobiaceae bacterium]
MTNTVNKESLASLVICLKWRSEQAEHRDCYLARKANIWRDMFPPGMEQELLGKGIGDRIRLSYAPGQALEDRKSSLVRILQRSQFRPGSKDIEPRLGRFYPKGFLFNVAGIYPQNEYPFRVIGLDEESFEADLNHPLAGKELEVEVRILDVAEKMGDVGGRINVWVETAAEKGPGMQARYRNQPTDFHVAGGDEREDPSKDSLFYQAPRLVSHVDRQASWCIRQEYAGYLQQGSNVLDLMSSVQSHLPEDRDLEVTGLGLNQAEMEHNPQLQHRRIQDLNERSELPFTDGAFDAAVCSLSIEYLLNPDQVLAEMSRVLKPGGELLISLSNRWFPPKVTRFWLFLHEFERMGWVLDCLQRRSELDDFKTYSMRNWWRPQDDPRAGELPASDPVYVIRARKQSG